MSGYVTFQRRELSRVLPGHMNAAEKGFKSGHYSLLESMCKYNCLLLYLNIFPFISIEINYWGVGVYSKWITGISMLNKP